MTIRSGWAASDWMRVGRRPDELDAITASGETCAVTSRITAILTSSRSGTFSCTKSASTTASSMLDAKVSRSWLAPSASPSPSIVGHTVAMFSRKCSSAPGAGSVTLTSSPCARQRTDHPVPITPPPTNPTRSMLLRPLNAMICSWAVNGCGFFSSPLPPRGNRLR